ITYVTLILIMPALAGLAYVAARGGTKRIRAAGNARSVVCVVFSITAYGLVLFALTTAPAASVAATREVSVVFAAILGAVFLHERVGASRLVGSVVVVIGIALVVLG